MRERDILLKIFIFTFTVLSARFFLLFFDINLFESKINNHHTSYLRISSFFGNIYFSHKFTPRNFHLIKLIKNIINKTG